MRHFGGAHMGQDEQIERVEALVAKKEQLEAALPVVDDNKAMLIEDRLDKIEAQLERELARSKAIGTEAAVRSAMGLDGSGGLEFQVQAPGGVGRLVRLPFYPQDGASTGYITGAGDTTASTDVPVIGATITNSYGGAGPTVAQLSSFIMKTPQISWALLRIVGFEIEIHNAQTTAPSKALDFSIADGAGAAVLSAGLTLNESNAVPLPKIIVKDLQVGGGATLFTHEDFGDGAIYDASQPEFCGLRDYPILKSPNIAQVEIAALGCGSAAGEGATGANVTAPGAGSTTGVNNGFQSIVFSANLLCEVLSDDNYGSHIPGPYARGNAMLRRGGSFIS
jgi:hypothetical protein